MPFARIHQADLERRCAKVLLAAALAKAVHGDGSAEHNRAKDLIGKVCDHLLAQTYVRPIEIDGEGNEVLGSVDYSKVGEDPVSEMDQIDRWYQKEDISLILGAKEADDGRK